MQHPHVTDNDVVPTPAIGTAGGLRLAIGLLQGLTLYALHKSWTGSTWLSDQPALYIALVMVAALLPPAAILSMRHLSRRALGIWLCVLTVVLFAAGWYDGWRLDLSTLLPASPEKGPVFKMPSSALCQLCVSGLFIAQALMLAAAADGTPIASYRRYVDTAWKLSVQLLLALLFSGLFWIVLQTGGTLFALIELDILRKLTAQAWFSLPVTTLVFAFALHMGDMRAHMIEGIRRLLLTLLSWLLPVAMLLSGGFLLSLFVTGLRPLWQTHFASSGLLGAAVLLVLLINTVYQDGLRPWHETGRVLTACVRVACLLPLPLVLLTLYAQGMRVAEYGWTVSRVYGALCTGIAAIYAVGYACAAIRRHDGLRQIAGTNIVAAFAVLLSFLALMTPVANPARIAVSSQLARLDSGSVVPARFDFRFLRFQGERYGVAALARLSRQQTGTQAGMIRQYATQALAARTQWDDTDKTGELPDLTKNIRMHPDGRALPAGLLSQNWGISENFRIPACMKQKGALCDAYAITPDPDNEEQLLIFNEQNFPALFAQTPAHGWQLVGTFSLSPACKEALKQAATRGTLRWQLPLHRDLEFNGQRLSLQPEQENITCPPPAAAQ